MDDLVVFGTGGVSRQVFQIVMDINDDDPRWRLLGFLDDDAEQHGRNVHGLEVLGGLSWLRDKPECHVVVAVATPKARRSIVERLTEIGHTLFASIVHPTACIGAATSIGDGAIVYPGVLIDTDVSIGSHVILNKGCTVGHDAVLENFVTIGPGVNLGGAIRIGAGSDLGIGCSTIQNVTIGAGSVVGAGAVVIRDVPDGATVVGVPAKPIGTSGGSRGD